MNCSYKLLALGLALLIFFGSVQGLRAESDLLRVAVELDLTQEEAEPREQAGKLLKMGFAKAALHKINELLPAELLNEQEQILFDFLVPRAESFVLSYSEQGLQRDGNVLRMPLAVKINTWALRDFLQRWGTYYTAGASWEYVLRLTGDLQEKDLLLVKAMQELSGLSRKDSGFPELTLQLADDTDPWWRGKLQTEDEQWTHAAANLQEVWSTLWAEYFAQSAVQERVVQSLVLQARGWSAISGIWAFDREITAWSQLAKQPRIISIQLSQGLLKANWNIKTRQEQNLRKRLHQELKARGLSFRLEPASEFAALDFYNQERHN